MGLFNRNKKNKTLEKSDESQDWSKDLKRNTASKKLVSQKGFDFIENVDIDIVTNTLETKKGLSFNVEDISCDQVKILKNCMPENSAAELIKILNRTNKTKFKQDILDPLIDCGFFELTVPEKPKSPKQKYRLTEKFTNKRNRI